MLGPPGCDLGRDPRAKASSARAAEKTRSRFLSRNPSSTCARNGVLGDIYLSEANLAH